MEKEVRQMKAIFAPGRAIRSRFKSLFAEHQSRLHLSVTLDLS